MVFKRRDRRPIWQIVLDFIYPRGGWARAFEYVKHRVRRLPDTPEKISRGIAVGVFASFTPFYGLHFVIAALLAQVMRGNILAALLGTFFGNPLTYIPIGVAALSMGHLLLGRPFNAAIFGFGDRAAEFCGLGCRFGNAFSDITHNFIAMFTPARADWHGLAQFYHELFLPYMVGGIIPGILCGAGAYYICVPLISVYQKRRRKVLRDKLSQLNKKPEITGDDSPR
ncbi:DUF2062 domain-containing protein [Loktanella sp. D2R18]|uniref:DUF2062 domain-containing protein n=1 Tax=Yoonia sp. 1_MG-2023 TaxID=3062659 RepID=UPI000DEA3711|nr:MULTISPECIES: DUF2062 domain-containing protein [Rhodobacterales]MDO6591322.1 DUF2062 domain-containing protein [Yoonia sp. 1_MG-2023]RBW46272.1 DUF2062 domain-containing protein [Loktanella sp. D2R18]